MYDQKVIVKNPMNILTGEQIKSIHSGVLNVLEKTGVIFNHAEALKIFEESGCNVDKKKRLVKFKGNLVEECLEKCPRSFILKARDPKYDLKVGDPNLYFGTFSGKEHLDTSTFERRPPKSQEMVEAWITLDYLDRVHFPLYSYGSVEEVIGPFWYPYKASIVAKNTVKAGSGWVGGPDQAHKWTTKIFNAAGITPLASIPASPPLAWYKDPIDVLIDSAKAGIPLKPASGIAAGANAPATLAGALVQNVAEVISSIVLAQLINPGLPIICQDYSQALDMRTGSVIQGGIERGLMGAAWCQIWRNYGIPRMTMMASDAKVPDYQCAMEKVMSITLHALAGSNVISFMGTVYDELIFSPVVAIIDNDIAHMVERFLGGININDETLALDLIEKVGPLPGQFLDTKHTREMWKQEQLLPHIVDRLSYPEWENQGRKDILTRAKEKYEQILKTHKPIPLSQGQCDEIDAILKEAKSFYQERGQTL